MQELWDSFWKVSEKLISIFEFEGKDKEKNFDISNYSYETSNIKVCMQNVLSEENDINFYGLKDDSIGFLYLPYIQNYNEEIAKNELRKLKLFNFEEYTEKDIKGLTCFCISLFILVKMYICFKDSKRNYHLVEELFMYFDNTDVSNFPGRNVTNKSTLELKLTYLKIKFSWLFNSLANYLFTEMYNINYELDFNNNGPFYWITAHYFKLISYEKKEIVIPNGFYKSDIPEDFKTIIKKDKILKIWECFYYILKDNKQCICNNCYTIFHKKKQKAIQILSKM